MIKLRLLVALSMIFLVTACDTVIPTPELILDFPDETVIELSPKGEKRHIGFTSALAWSAEVVDGGHWLKVSPSEGDAGNSFFTLHATANLEPGMRTAIVRLSSADLHMDLEVVQDTDFVEVFELSASSFELPVEGGTIEIRVNTNVDYYFDIIDGWILDPATKAVSEYVHIFEVSENDSEQQRSGTITFCAGDLCHPVTVVQAGKEPEDEEEGGNVTGGGNTESGSGDWTSATFRHKSLAVRVTADWCGYCPYMANAFAKALEMRPEGLELVSLHASGGLYYSAAGSMTDHYNITGYPTGIIDGRAKLPNYTDATVGANYLMYVVDETESSYPATTGIAFTSTLDGRNLSVDLDLYIKKPDTYKITVLLLEDDIIAYQNGGGSNYEHDHVVRTALSSPTGDSIIVTDDNTIWTKNYQVEVPYSCELSNLRVLVYVQKPYGEQNVVQSVSGVEYGDFGGWYVDNCLSAKTGTTAELKYS